MSVLRPCTKKRVGCIRKIDFGIFFISIFILKKMPKNAKILRVRFTPYMMRVVCSDEYRRLRLLKNGTDGNKKNAANRCETIYQADICILYIII